MTATPQAIAARAESELKAKLEGLTEPLLIEVVRGLAVQTDDAADIAFAFATRTLAARIGWQKVEEICNAAMAADDEQKGVL